MEMCCGSTVIARNQARDQASVIVIMAIRNTMQIFVALTLFFDDLEYLQPP